MTRATPRPRTSEPGAAASPSEPGTGADRTPPEGVPHELAKWISGAAEFLRRRVTGDYLVDDFGYDENLTESVLLPAMRPLFERWFRVDVAGIHNIPDTGGALIVANHAGIVAWDALMMQVAVHDEHPRHRMVRPLAADLVFHIPLLGVTARKAGATLACRADAERLLRNGELTAVFPEGFKGSGKPFEHRYQLQRFGRGGFVTSAIRTRTPIIPCSIVGSEETYPKLADLTPLAKLLGLPYFPLTPTFPHFGPLGLIPLPSKWHIEFGEPIHTTDYAPDAADDPMIIFEVTDHVRETIQQTLHKLLAGRNSTFRG